MCSQSSQLRLTDDKKHVADDSFVSLDLNPQWLKHAVWFNGCNNSMLPLI